MLDADRLRQYGLQHLASCPLCDQEPETLRHLLLGRVVAREVWPWALRRWVKPDWVPTSDADLLEWWTSRACPKALRRDMWAPVILVFWCLDAYE
jgi:Ser/Thr protein kinase RdoA (MazF antagonist)